MNPQNTSAPNSTAANTTSINAMISASGGASAIQNNISKSLQTPSTPATTAPAVATNPTTPPLATPPTPPSQTTNASTLGNTPQLNYPNTQTTSDGSSVDANGNVTVPSSSSFVNGLPTQYTPPPDNPTLANAEENQNNLETTLGGLDTQEETKGTATQALYQSSGVYAAQQNMTALYNNLQTQTAQFNQQEENALEGTGSGQSQNIALGAEGLVQRQAAIQLGVDTAVYNAANNNYTTAKAIADQTISFQFAPIEQQIQDTKDFLTQNQTNLSVGQAKQAIIVQGSLALQSAQIDQAKADRTTSMSIMTDAAQSGLTDPTSLKAIANADPGTAASLAAPYLSFSYLQNLYLSGYLKTAPTPPGTTPTSSTTNMSSQTPAVANNNPGNLKDPTTGQFMQFPSMAAGFIALQQDLYAKGTGTSTTGLNANSTLSQFAATYAPASDGNDPTTYAQNIATTLGVPTSTKIGTLVSDPTQLKSFANAVSQEEDGTANQIVNGNQPITPSTSTQTQTNLQNANNIIQSAPLPFQGTLSTITSTGDIFSTATPGTPAGNWATTNGIKIVTPQEATSIKSIDTAASVLQNIQSNFSALAPTGTLGKLGSYLGSLFSTTFNTQKGEKIEAYNDTTLAAAASALSDITDISGNKLFSSSQISSALPQISTGKVAGVTSDTLQGGINKLNALQQTLNSQLKSILPNSPGITLSTPPSTSSPNLSSYQTSDGIIWTTTDGINYSPQTK